MSAADAVEVVLLTLCAYVCFMCGKVADVRSLGVLGVSPPAEDTRMHIKTYLILAPLCLLTACDSDSPQEDESPEAVDAGKADGFLEDPRPNPVSVEADMGPFPEDESCSRILPPGFRTLHIATRDGLEPILFDANNAEDIKDKRIKGTEIEIANFMCDTLGLECDFYYASWGNGCCSYDGVSRPPTMEDSPIFGGVYEGVYDMSVGGSSAKPDRVYYLHASTPTTTVDDGAEIVARPGTVFDHLDRVGNDLGDDGRTGLAGVRVGFMPGSTHEAYMRTAYPDAEFVEVRDADNAVENLIGMVLDGEVDVFLEGVFGLRERPEFIDGEIAAIEDEEGTRANIHETDPEGETLTYGPGAMFTYSPQLPGRVTQALDCAMRKMHEWEDEDGVSFIDQLGTNQVPPTIGDMYEEWFALIDWQPPRG